MKKILLMLAAACATTFAAQAQTPTATEPDFTGESVVVRADGSSKLLEKQTVMLRTRMGAGVYLVGIGKAKTKIVLQGTAAETRIPAGEDFQFIIRAVDNQTDPLSIINIFRLKVGSKERTAELSSTSTFGSVKEGKLERLPFTAKKFGTSSYLITLTAKPAGEYGITVSNPNHVDEKQIVVSTFAIEE